MPKQKYYAYWDKNNEKGQVFDNWEECKKVTHGMSGVVPKSFKTLSEAEDFARIKTGLKTENSSPIKAKIPQFDTTPIINPNQRHTYTVPCMSVDDYCQKYNFNHFTKEQRAAVETTDGKALLFAVPGSGKTTVIMARTGYLVHACNVNPTEIITLTFTKAAAEEMKTRYESNFPMDGGIVDFRTIHSFCWNIVLSELRSKGFKHPKNLIGGTNQYVIKGKGVTQTQIVKRVLKDCCKISKTNDEAAQNKIKIAVTGVKNTINLPDDLGEVTIKKLPIKVKDIYDYYQKLLAESDAFDLDDMLLYSYIGLREYPEVLFKLQERYKYWSIDEAQDNSELQYELINMLAGEKGNLYMVGDDDQSIYGFRAAKPSLMFEKFGSQPEVKKLHMSTNFRSDKAIVSASKQIIEKNLRREKKDMICRAGAKDGLLCIGSNFENEHSQYKYILDEIKKNTIQSKEKSVAVLYYYNISSLPIIAYLNKNNIPYKSSKSISEILSGLTVQTMIRYLKCAQNQKDFKVIYNSLSWLGIYLNKKYTKEQFEDVCTKNPEKTVLETILSVLDENSSNRESVNDTIHILKQIENQKPSMAVSILFRQTSIFDANSISDRLKFYAFMSTAELFETIDDLLFALKDIKTKEKSVAVLPANALQEEDESVFTSEKPQVFLSTIHSAKGKEYDRIMLIDCFDEALPGKPQDTMNYDPEEARRLFYVALTRAKHRLDILTVDRYHGNIEPPSKYIFDLAVVCGKLAIPTQAEMTVVNNVKATELIFDENEKDEKPNQKEKLKLSRIFISYSSMERNIADKVKLFLEKNGASCWMAPKSIPAGSNYTKEIPIAIKHSDAIVLILSKAAQESNWVPKEIDSAINNGKKIIPFQIDNKDLNYQFGFMLTHSQRIDAYNCLSDAFEELVDVLKE